MLLIAADISAYSETDVGLGGNPNNLGVMESDDNVAATPHLSVYFVIRNARGIYRTGKWISS
jgi:hypothetical protein